MQNRVIYDAALRLLGESTAEEENEDYEERAPYLIATFCSEMRELNEKLARAKGTASPELSECVCLALDEKFPLADRFSSAASLYLAAMLILEYDEDRSDKLYAQFSDAVSRIADGIPAMLETISNRYF